MSSQEAQARKLIRYPTTRIPPTYRPHDSEQQLVRHSIHKFSADRQSNHLHTLTIQSGDDNNNNKTQTMAPVDRVDHNALEQQLKDIIQDLYQIMVQVSTYDSVGRSSREVLTNEMYMPPPSLYYYYKSANEPEAKRSPSPFATFTPRPPPRTPSPR
ncbi:hypothetical protein F66182_6342, partial [Fusarium sp. NRRL 66182]